MMQAWANTGGISSGMLEINDKDHNLFHVLVYEPLINNSLEVQNTNYIFNDTVNIEITLFLKYLK